MSTEDEIMRDDFTQLLAERGTDRQVDGETLRCMVFGESLSLSSDSRGPGGYFGNLTVDTKKLVFLTGATAQRIADQYVDLGGERWQIAQVRTNPISTTWVLTKERG